MKHRLMGCALAMFLGTLSWQTATAQYYDWGQNPASVKWNKVRTPNGNYVFPRTYDRHAARIINYMDTVRPHIGNGFELGPMKMPVIEGE